jgi:hypothetical protein
MDDCATKSVGSPQRLFDPHDLSVRVPLPRAELATIWRAKDGSRVLSIVAGGKSHDFALSPAILVMLVSEAMTDLIRDRG